MKGLETAKVNQLDIIKKRGNLAGPGIKVFYDKIQVAVDKEMDALLPDKRGAYARVRLRYKGFADMPRGEPEQLLVRMAGCLMKAIIQLREVKR